MTAFEYLMSFSLMSKQVIICSASAAALLFMANFLVQRACWMVILLLRVMYIPTLPLIVVFSAELSVCACGPCCL